MDDFRPDPRARARDAGLARLKRATRLVLFAATALAGAFAGLAAHSFGGHKARAAPVVTRTVRRAQTQAATLQTPATTPAATTTVAPVTTTQAPVAVSGAT
jgi:hypothetical protein